VASFVLSVYVLLRVGDLWHRGALPGAIDGSWQSGLFAIEIAVSAVVPAGLLMLRRVRESIAGLTSCSLMVVLGIIGYRFNICIVAFERPEGMPYWPTWTELAVSVGIVSGAVLVFIFFNENLRIVEDHHAEEPSPEPPVETTSPEGLAPAVRRHSLVFVVAAALAVGFLPEDAIFGPKPRGTPAQTARLVEALATPAAPPVRRVFHVSSLAGNVPAALQPKPVSLLMIDGNRDWRFVPFTHDEHIAALGGRESCRVCHHQNMTFDQQSACHECHRDMYETTDTFDHALHIHKLGGNAACTVCHPAGIARKSRETSLACWQCHGDMVVQGSIVPTVERTLVGLAPGYVDALHGLCIRCHEQLAQRQPETYANFDRCDVCHREFQDTHHRRMAPYVPMPPGHVQAAAMTGVAPVPPRPAVLEGVPGTQPSGAQP
jgi:hypothetical protein